MEPRAHRVPVRQHRDRRASHSRGHTTRNTTTRHRRSQCCETAIHIFYTHYIHSIYIYLYPSNMTLLGVPNAASAAAATTAPTFHIGTTTSAAASNNMNLSLGTCVCVCHQQRTTFYTTLRSIPHVSHTIVISSFLYIYTHTYILDDIMKARSRSNVEDRAIGTRTARNKSAKNARRGITTSKEPTAAQIAKEVQTQTLRTIVKTNAQNVMNALSSSSSSTAKQQRRGGGKQQQHAATMAGNNKNGDATTTTQKSNTRKDRVSVRQQQREMQQAAQQLAAVTTTTTGATNPFTADVPIPTRTMIQAAKKAMENAGYIFPQRTTLRVVSTASLRNINHPTTTTPLAPAPRGGGRGGGRRGGGRTNHNNNNNNNNYMEMNG